jgi:NifU-like protein involved in Fe-S cluster formation
MGVDVSSHSGVIASTSEILKLVNGKNKKIIIEICQSFYDKLKSLKKDII